MNALTCQYIERVHPVFGHILRPAITLHLHSTLFDQWLVLNDVLVDTGADISVAPLPLGQILIDHIEDGQPIRLGGVVASSARHNAFVHHIQARVGEHAFEMPVAIAISQTIPPIVGRLDALDRFTAHFIKGQKLILDT